MDNLEKRIRKEAVIRLNCLPEDLQIEGNAMASGDKEADERCYAEIRQQLDNGNEWAWCCAQVTAEWEGLTGEDYLGGCSYKSAEDFKTSYFMVKKPGQKRFRKSGGYYDDMKETAIQQVIDQARKIVSKA